MTRKVDVAMTLPASGPLWQYTDARGIVHRGKVASVRDYGGTDITHAYQSACGAYVMVSGSRLRAARVLPAATDARCDHPATAATM